jgi:hypothetical protein
MRRDETRDARALDDAPLAHLAPQFATYPSFGIPDVTSATMPKKRASKGSRRGVRELKSREPKLFEGARSLLVLRGPTTSDIGVSALRDFVR